MPAARKVTWAELRVGLVVLAGLGVFTFAASLGRNLFTAQTRYVTYLPDVAGLQIALVIRLEPRRVDLLNLVTEHVDLPSPFPLAFCQHAQLTEQDRASVDSLGDLSAKRGQRGPTERVEQLEVDGRPKQPLALMLPGDFHDQVPEFAQHADGGRAAVDPRAGATLRGDLAGYDELIGVESRLPQPPARRPISVDVEARLDARAARARPDEVARHSRAERRRQSVNDHGLAGAGLPGQDVETRAEFQGG